jgi:hypothetical protein
LARQKVARVRAQGRHAVERFCRDALAEHARLFRLWHKFGSGQIDRNQLVLRSIPIEKRIFVLAERHLDSSHREVRNLATALFEHNERLFTFLEHEGVEPTNNSAERALRTGVRGAKSGNRSNEVSRRTASGWFDERPKAAVHGSRRRARRLLADSNCPTIHPPHPARGCMCGLFRLNLTVDTANRAQKCSPEKFRSLPLAGNRDALFLQEPIMMRHRALRWNRTAHVHMVRHQVPLR